MRFPRRRFKGERERARARAIVPFPFFKFVLFPFFIFVSGTQDGTRGGRKLGGTEATNKSVLERANETVGTREREISFVAGGERGRGKRVEGEDEL